MRFGFAWWALASLAAAASSPASEGLKIVVLESFPAGTIETTEYVAADSARVEWRLSSGTPDHGRQERGYLHIRRCDLNQLIILDPRDRSYQTAPLRTDLTILDRAALKLRRHETESQAGPHIVVETTTIDTGERRVAFGQSARRVRTIRRQFPENHPGSAEETLTDGWYIDLDTRVSCERAERGRSVLIAVATRSGERTASPRVIFKDIGKAEDGFPVDTTVTAHLGSPDLPQQPQPVVTRRVVTHLSREPLDPNLFEVPAGFRCTDRRFTHLAARWQRTADIVRSVVASWF
jgi:hypothetical protein